MRNHSTTIIGILAIIVIVVMTLLLIPRHPKVHTTNGNIPVSQWKYAGYGTPKSSILSAAAGLRKENGQVFVDSLTPEMRRFFEFIFQPTMQKNHKTLAQLVSAHVPRATANTTIHIVKLQELNDRWAQAVVKISDGGKPRTLTVVLRKIDGEWKVDDFE